jgi:ribosomal protein S18 acetylase RimI-like enzyme
MELCELSDGTAFALQELTTKDVDWLMSFFTSLSSKDRRYLRFDVTRKDLVLRRLEESETGRAYRAAAVVKDEIVGYCAILMSQESWQAHIGEIRLIIKPEFRGKQLAPALISHLVKRAEKSGVERLVIKVAAPQIDLRHTLEEHGFHIDAVLPNQVKDREGKVHPLVVMSCSLSEMAQTLREFYRSADWPDG